MGRWWPRCVSTFILLYDTPNGVYWRSLVYCLMHIRGFYFVFVNADLTDFADAMRKVYDKNRIITPCVVTLILRVCDGECL